MSFRGRIRELASGTEREVVDLFDRWQAGGMSEAEFVAAAAAVIARANGRTTRAADRAAAIQMSRLLRRRVSPLGLSTEDARDHVRKGIRTLLDEDPDVAETPEQLTESRRKRLSRLARNEPLQAAAAATGAALGARALGWTRGIGPDACPLCEEWDDGEVRPAEVRMPRHTGCSCVQIPARL